MFPHDDVHHLNSGPLEVIEETSGQVSLLADTGVSYAQAQARTPPRSSATQRVAPTKPPSPRASGAGGEFVAKSMEEKAREQRSAKRAKKRGSHQGVQPHADGGGPGEAMQELGLRGGAAGGPGRRLSREEAQVLYGGDSPPEGSTITEQEALNKVLDGLQNAHERISMR